MENQVVKSIKIRAYENFHIVLWLIKDMSWVLLWRPLGLAMILPTLFVALHLTWKSRTDISELLHNTAICCWICANSIWMVGEFYFEDGLRSYAKIFFVIGLCVIGIYYFYVLPKKLFFDVKQEKQDVDRHV
jgi:hypothetical protein